jgi:hypothetical protein
MAVVEQERALTEGELLPPDLDHLRTTDDRPLWQRLLDEAADVLEGREWAHESYGHDARGRTLTFRRGQVSVYAPRSDSKFVPVPVAAEEIVAVCALGAISLAAVESDWLPPDQQVRIENYAQRHLGDTLARDDRVRALLRQEYEFYVDSYWESDGPEDEDGPLSYGAWIESGLWQDIGESGIVAEWNDHVASSKEEVVAALRRSAWQFS